MTALNRQQIVGFWTAWAGWLLDGMDSVIYALVLTPALKELLPLSGMTHMANNEVVAENLLLLQVDFLRRSLDL